MIIDLILILITAGFVISGYKRGLVESLGSLLGFIFTLLIMARLYPWLMNHFQGDFWTKILVFILALIVIVMIIRLAVWIIEKIFNLFSFIPGTRSLNKILGAGIGLISGLLMSSFLVWMLLEFPVENNWLGNQIQNSFLIKPMLLIAYVWIPIVPHIYREIKNKL